MKNKKKILFVDRDGTIIEEPADFQIDQLEKFKLVSNVIPALLKLKAMGYKMVMVSNQDGLGTESFATGDFEGPQNLLLQILKSQSIVFDEILICPHLPADNCECRKPKLGLVNKYIFSQDMDLENSFVIGDRDSDLELAKNMGIGSFLVDASNDQAWLDIVTSIEQHFAKDRRAEIKRQTKETEINLKINLDCAAPVKVSTGLGFFDHMIEQVAHHGGFSLDLNVSGDLQVDEHHTVEDVALALGECMSRALGDRRGIERFSFVLPMDESKAQVALDLGGRPYMVFKGKFDREAVGDLPCELVPHFFRSFCETLGASLHLEVTGENTHHMVESLFKALGRCLRQAVRRNLKEGVPSTKGQI